MKETKFIFKERNRQNNLNLRRFRRRRRRRRREAVLIPEEPKIPKHDFSG